MFKLNIQDCTSLKQYDQNDKARVVVDCNDAVIDKEREQESHITPWQAYFILSKLHFVFGNPILDWQPFY